MTRLIALVLLAVATCGQAADTVLYYGPDGAALVPGKYWRVTVGWQNGQPVVAQTVLFEVGGVVPPGPPQPPINDMDAKVAALLAAVTDAANAVLANNHVQIAGHDGLRVMSGTNVEISGNSLENIDNSGVTLIGVEYGLVTNNTVEFAGLHGIQIVEGSYVDVTANTVERAIGNGIQISGLDFLGTVEGNTISEAQTGIQARGFRSTRSSPRKMSMTSSS